MTTLDMKPSAPVFSPFWSGGVSSDSTAYVATGLDWRLGSRRSTGNRWFA